MMATPSLRPPIHILGAGSIGQLWAVSIRSKFPQYPVTLLLRGNHKKGSEKEDSSGSRTLFWKPLSSPEPQRVNVPVQYVDDDTLQDPIHTLLVTTKSYQAKDAVQKVLHRLTHAGAATNTTTSPRIVLLCNGALSVQDDLSSLLLSNDISLILATTTHGAYREDLRATKGVEAVAGDTCLVHAGIGKAFIEETATDLALLWGEAGLNCSTMSCVAMNELLWKKLAANCVINPLTALYQCTNGELLLEPSFFELQQELLSEIARVAQATTKNESLDEDCLRQFVQQVIQDTKDNKSSMLQDVLHQKRTEIDHLNGFIMKKGRTLGIECPCNEDLAHRIKATNSAAGEN